MNAAALTEPAAQARSDHERAFADLVAHRRRLGLEHHAPGSHLIGPPLLEPIAMEAIDGFNYTRMELDRLARQFPHPRGRGVEHVGKRVVRAPAAENELDDGSLLGIQLVEGGH